MANRFKVVNNSAVPPRPEGGHGKKSYTQRVIFFPSTKNPTYCSHITVSLHSIPKKLSPSYPQLVGTKENISLFKTSWRKATAQLSRILLSFRFYQEAWTFWGHFGSPKTLRGDEQIKAVTPVSKVWYKKWHTSWTSSLNNCAMKQFAAFSIEWEWVRTNHSEISSCRSASHPALSTNQRQGII